METYLVIGGSSAVGKSIISELLLKGNMVCATFNDTNIEIVHENLKTIKWETSEEWNKENVLTDTIDGIVYCPGMITLKPFHRFKTEDFLRDLDVQVFGAIRVIQGALEQLMKSSNASIVLISSIAVQRGFPFHSMIGVSKGAIEGLIKNLAAEYAPKIRVNGIAPSIIDSKMTSRILNNKIKRENIAENHPLKRIGRPDDIGKMASFLLSKDSSWISGQIIPVDGGKSNLLN
jgi:NAD(P)-dependent dehydrogenase (short-subunit alcohol dehydrogenase family)